MWFSSHERAATEGGRPRRASQYGFGRVALVGLLAATTACGLPVRFDRATRDDDPAAAPSPETRRPVEILLETTPARTLRYASLVFTVTKGAIVGGDAGATAEITLSVNNPLKEDVAVHSALWTLELGDGTAATAPYSANVEARDTREQKLELALPKAASWDGAKLSLDEEDKAPATVALDGPVTSAPFPRVLGVGAGASTAEPALAYRITSASLDLDGAGSRAEDGKLYLNLTVRMSDESGDGSEQFAPEFFHLLVNGASVAPEAIDDAVLLPSSSKDIAMSFVIPEDATSVELEVGKADFTTARIPVDLAATDGGSSRDEPGV